MLKRISVLYLFIPYFFLLSIFVASAAIGIVSILNARHSHVAHGRRILRVMTGIALVGFAGWGAKILYDAVFHDLLLNF
jgi:hypothetical protein